MRRALLGDVVEEDTFRVIKKVVSEGEWNEFLNLAIPAMLELGCYKGLLALFKITGDIDKNDPRESFFNAVFFELLTCNGDDNPFTITAE